MSLCEPLQQKTFPLAGFQNGFHISDCYQYLMGIDSKFYKVWSAPLNTAQYSQQPGIKLSSDVEGCTNVMSWNCA